MTDVFESGSEWLAEQLTNNASRPVTYSRGSKSCIVNASIGETPFETVDQMGILMNVRSRDYIFQADELIISGSVVLPERGDQITDEGNIYEVLAPGNAPHFRFSDPYFFCLRVHTKQVG